MIFPAPHNEATALLLRLFGRNIGLVYGEFSKPHFGQPTRSRADRKDAKAKFGWTVRERADGTKENVKAKPFPGFVQRVGITKPISARKRHRSAVALRKAGFTPISVNA